MGYLQFVSEAGSTKARHASSTRQRALRTLIAEQAARAHGRRSGDRAGRSAEGELWVWAQLYQLCCGPARAQAEQPGAKGTARSQPPAREGKRWLGHFLEAFRCWGWRSEGVVGRGRAQRVRSEAKESLSEVLCHCLQFCIYFFPLESEVFQWWRKDPLSFPPSPLSFSLSLSLFHSLFPYPFLSFPFSPSSLLSNVQRLSVRRMSGCQPELRSQFGP